MTTKRQMSPEAKVAAQARMSQFWADVKAGRRESPQAAKARKQQEAKANGRVKSQSFPPPVVRPVPTLRNVTAPVGEASSPRSVEPSPALISLFKSGSVYVLRISDVCYNNIAAAIGRELKDGTSVVVVTPTDTKMFELKGGGREQTQGNPKTTVEADTTTVLSETEATDEFQHDPQAEAQRLAAEAEGQARSAGAESVADLEDQLANAETPAQRREALKAIQRAQVQPDNSTCLRCRGEGHYPVALESGGVVDQACPVCKGKGEIIRYGMGRR